MLAGTGARLSKKQIDQSLRLRIRPFALSAGIVMAALTVILSVWVRTTGFGAEFMDIFYGLHPSPYARDMLEPGPLKHSIGVLIDGTYAFVDIFILTSIWAFLYNMFAKRV